MGQSGCWTSANLTENPAILLVPVTPGSCHVSLQQVGGGVSDHYRSDHVDVLDDSFQAIQVGYRYLLSRRKASLTMPTGVFPERCSRRMRLASSNCQSRVRLRGLYSATTKSPWAAAFRR